MPRNQDVLDEFEKRLTGEQNDIRDFLVRLRWVTQLILTVFVPFGFTAVGRLVSWQKPFSAPVPLIVFIVLLAIQGFLVYANFKWTPRIDRFAELAKLRGMLLEVSREALAYRDATNAYSFALAALRSPLTPAKGTSFPPILEHEDEKEKFKRLAKEIVEVFGTHEVRTFLGNGSVPKRFCVSLYGLKGVKNGKTNYELIHRRTTGDYRKIRDNHPEEIRVWAFDEAILTNVSKQSKPYVTDDLQAFPKVPVPKRRTYDGELYRGAMFARSNWYLHDGGLNWDSKSEKPPAYLLIFTSGEVGAFKGQEDSVSNELLIEAVRDLLDTLLAFAYRKPPDHD